MFTPLAAPLCYLGVDRLLYVHVMLFTRAVINLPERSAANYVAAAALCALRILTGIAITWMLLEPPRFRYTAVLICAADMLVHDHLAAASRLDPRDPSDAIGIHLCTWLFRGQFFIFIGSLCAALTNWLHTAGWI